MIEMFLLTLVFVSPILIAAVGGMLCERVGVVNIALEGLMSIGAVTAAITHVLLETRTGFSIPLALSFAALGGGLLSLIHGFASVSLKANQLVSGTGINLFCGGVSVFICQLLFRMDRSMSYNAGMTPGFLGIYPSVWIALVVFAASWFFLYKRPKNLVLKTTATAAIAATANINRIRYIAILTSGLLAGLAGACIVLTQDIQFTANTINGEGFIALAAVLIGRKLPLGILGISFLSGLFLYFADNVLNITNINLLPPDLLNILPFLIALFALVAFSRRNRHIYYRSEKG